jgi:hypothetical protein
MRTVLGLTLFLALACTARSADEPALTPRPVPLTRPELKQYLENMKTRKPLIPLPALSAEEKAQLGERAGSYEARLRYHYMPAGDGRGGAFSREPDPRMSLDYAFKVELFWIVSRTTNCHY